MPTGTPISSSNPVKLSDIKAEFDVSSLNGMKTINNSTNPYVWTVTTGGWCNYTNVTTSLGTGMSQFKGKTKYPLFGFSTSAGSTFYATAGANYGNPGVGDTLTGFNNGDWLIGQPNEWNDGTYQTIYGFNDFGYIQGSASSANFGSKPTYNAGWYTYSTQKQLSLRQFIYNRDKSSCIIKFSAGNTTFFSSDINFTGGYVITSGSAVSFTLGTGFDFGPYRVNVNSDNTITWRVNGLTFNQFYSTTRIYLITG